MERNEAIAKGVKVEETRHSMKRRASMHDYNSRGMYMITLVAEDRQPLFGSLRGKSADEAYVELSPLGKAIRDEEIHKISHYYPQVDVLKLCIMPDHLHLILFVREALPAGKHLGLVVSGFKAGCSKAWWRINPVPSGEPSGTKQETSRPSIQPSAPASSSPAPCSVPEGSCSVSKGSCSISEGSCSVPEGSPEGIIPPPRAKSRPVLFEKGYNDKLLLHAGQLDNWKAYLDENPVRLWLKRKNPEAFTVLHGLFIAGHSCQAVGNRFLLSIPDKVAVIVHRRYTAEENARLREEWLACGERGGVLVSAAISPKEKEVLREAMNRGYRIILLRENGFPELYKPSGEAFYACVEGRLLQISPWPYHMDQRPITRQQCLALNSLAEALARE